MFLAASCLDICPAEAAELKSPESPSRVWGHASSRRDIEPGDMVHLDPTIDARVLCLCVHHGACLTVPWRSRGTSSVRRGILDCYHKWYYGWLLTRLLLPLDVAA
jgi:ferredoxin